MCVAGRRSTLVAFLISHRQAHVSADLETRTEGDEEEDLPLSSSSSEVAPKEVGKVCRMDAPEMTFLECGSGSGVSPLPLEDLPAFTKQSFSDRLCRIEFLRDYLKGVKANLQPEPR